MKQCKNILQIGIIEAHSNVTKGQPHLEGVITNRRSALELVINDHLGHMFYLWILYRRIVIGLYIVLFSIRFVSNRLFDNIKNNTFSFVHLKIKNLFSYLFCSSGNQHFDSKTANIAFLLIIGAYTNGDCRTNWSNTWYCNGHTING